MIMKSTVLFHLLTEAEENDAEQLIKRQTVSYSFAFTN